MKMRMDMVYCKDISIDDIDLEDHTYKISKNNVNDDLVNSIITHGIIDPPLLKQCNGTLKIVTGHNRLGIFYKNMTGPVRVKITPELTADMFISSALLKNYHDELGPYGKVKMLHILKTKFDYDYSEDENIKKDFNLPGYVCFDENAIPDIMNLPGNLLHFLDEKNIGFKVIKKIIMLDQDIIRLISDWFELISFRVNIFKGIIDLLTDLSKLDRTEIQTGIIDKSRLKESRNGEQLIHDTLFKLRYPEYSMHRQKFEEAASLFNDKGIDVEFPKFFNGDQFFLKIVMKKGDTKDKIKTVTDSIRTEELDMLSKLL